MWADVRKLRPIEDLRDLPREHRAQGVDDGHRQRGIHRKWRFALWPDATADPSQMAGLARLWDDFTSICESGFDTTPYVCEILSRTIEWAVAPTYRISQDNLRRSYGNTSCSTAGATKDRPFLIKVNVAADLLWPLLVDEYSPAEKAAATVYVAVTMLHEISVSPRRLVVEELPPWITFRSLAESPRL